MKTKKIKLKILEGLAQIPLLDVHTHLDASHLAARGLHDILLYHMVVSDLVSAGCPSRERLSEDPDDIEATRRIEEAIPYLDKIHNTSLFWGIKMILRNLYGWNEPITQSNWRRLDGMIRERSFDPVWPRMILMEARIKRSCTELWRRRDGSRDNLLQYSLEWAFFNRAQLGVNDIPLFELERAWNQKEPSPPLPVTLGEKRPVLEKTIRTMDDAHSALDHYINCIPFDQIISTAQHFSTDIHYLPPSKPKFVAALPHRGRASQLDRDIYASYILENFLSRLEEHAENLVYHFSIGAEPLPYETGSKLHQETIFDLAAIIERHPRLRFQALLSSEHNNQALCTLARELPNLSLAGYWWHNFFPGTIQKVIGERLDMLAVNKQVGFFSDAYCVEWAYAKSCLVRQQWAEVLAKKVEQGQFNVDEALTIAREVLFETPQILNGMEPNENS